MYHLCDTDTAIDAMVSCITDGMRTCVRRSHGCAAMRCSAVLTRTGAGAAIMGPKELATEALIDERCQVQVLERALEEKHIPEIKWGIRFCGYTGKHC